MSVQFSLTRSQRRKIQAQIRCTDRRIVANRGRILLLLDDGLKVAEVADRVGCVRATVYRTIYRLEDFGLDALEDLRRWRLPMKATREVRKTLQSYVDGTPKDYGWQRSTWTLELLSRQLESDTGVKLSASHVRRILLEGGCRRGRARPTLRIPVRGRRKVLEKLEKLVKSASGNSEVLFSDEVDIDLNPRIGFTYMRKGQQPQIPTPGQNVKYYVAGALNARTGSLTRSDGPRKNSELFIDLLKELPKRYPRAKTIHLIVDNYIIHKSGKTIQALKNLGGRVRLHFLPPYSPNENRIERLWKQLHDNVTRNHRHETFPSLWKDVVAFLDAVQPFPGTKASTLRSTG